MKRTQLTPQDLVLRCYGKKTKTGWYAHCIDVNIDAEAETFESVKASLEDALTGYFLTVLETNESASIVPLIFRPSSLRHQMTYHWLSVILGFNQLSQRIFQETIPIQLAPRCT